MTYKFEGKIRMKVSFLGAVATAAIVLGSPVQADLLPVTTEELKIFDKIEAGDTSYDDATMQFYGDMKKCYKYQTNNQQEADECAHTAKTSYLARKDGAQAPLTGISNVSSPAVTEVADSNYSIQGGDSKGWKESTQE